MYEKRGWTADAHLYADSAIANYNMENFYENWMRVHRDDQTRTARSGLHPHAAGHQGAGRSGLVGGYV